MIDLRALDAAVAEEVIGAMNVGWDDDGLTNALVGELPYGHSTRNQGWLPGRQRIPNYSTDIAAAWEVVEAMRRTQYPDIEMRSLLTGGYIVTFAYGWGWAVPQATSTGKTAAEAICRAALNAVREKGESR